MSKDGNINSWLRLAIAVSLFRVINDLIASFFILVAYVAPWRIFNRLYAFGPVLAPLLGISTVVWFVVAMSDKLFTLTRKIKLILAIVFSVIALCPLYTKLDVNPKMDSSQVKKLVHASSQGNITKVRKLLHDGVDPNAALNLNGWTSLHIAAAGGHTDVVKALLDAGVPANSKTKVKGMETEAVFFAAMYGHTNVIAVLAARGADLHRTFRGMTLPEYALHYKHPETAHFIEDLIAKENPNQPLTPNMGKRKKG